uniref:Uncharacterized protein n=2 Tax=Spongospora subterranea TaxID=70186 RepID=A0A0H5QP32_9EUKA|eukprot:CRZ03367.1 hypothetical protein [Spongospora subterranea]
MLPSLCRSVVQITAGARHSMCLTDQGRVCSWGDGSQGQLGHGDVSSFTIPHPIISLDGKGVKHILAGPAQSLAFTQPFIAPTLVPSLVTSEFNVDAVSAPSMSEPPSSLNGFNGTFASDCLEFVSQSPRNSATLLYVWNGRHLEVDAIESDRVQLVHRCVHFEVSEEIPYRGALNFYLRKCYDRDAYVFKHLTTTAVKHECRDHRSIKGTLLLVCQVRALSAVAGTDSIPDWISWFLDAFHPLDVAPRFVQLAPPPAPS